MYRVHYYAGRSYGKSVEVATFGEACSEALLLGYEKPGVTVALTNEICRDDECDGLNDSEREAFEDAFEAGKGARG